MVSKFPVLKEGVTIENTEKGCVPMFSIFSGLTELQMKELNGISRHSGETFKSGDYNQ
jgi:hypothetical protein